MVSALPINVGALLRFQGFESSRVELKASWNEETTGPQVIRTLCAFANDFQGLNGGYVVIGVAEEGGRAVLPPRGLSHEEVERAQRWIRGRCNQIDPIYQPIFSPEVIDDRLILVVWAPASDVRPHQAPDGGEKGARRFYIRLGNETVEADRYPDLKTELLRMTAKVPFDERRAHQASLHDISETKVREFLHRVGSQLVNEPDARELYRSLRITVPVNGHDAPKNIALLFFSQYPEKFFPGARIEVVQFGHDDSSTILSERIFNNRPVHEQVVDCLTYLEGFSSRWIEKNDDRPEATHWFDYPSRALREALVNAVYHRSYEDSQEPTKVYIYPNRIEIVSHPGPLPGIEMKHLEGLAPFPHVPPRNRRIGELLKELRLAEGRHTGLPTLRREMSANGSPQPLFDFDEARTYFAVTLPVHPPPG